MKLRILIFVLALMVFHVAQAHGQISPAESEVSQGYIQGNEYGAIHWENGTVNATGNGVAAIQTTNAAQGNLLAVRAATVAARRHLFTLLQEIQIDSRTTVGNYLKADEAATAVVRGLLQNSPVLRIVQGEDGSFEVTVAVELRDDMARVLLPKPKPVVPMVSSPPVLQPVDSQTTLEDMPADALNATMEAPVTLAMPANEYTGLIIDALGLRAQPGISPRLLNENGQELYGVNVVGIKSAIANGMAGYFQDMQAAMESARTGSNPLLLRAKKVVGPAGVDLMLDTLESQRFLLVAEMGFIKECRVAILLD